MAKDNFIHVLYQQNQKIRLPNRNLNIFAYLEKSRQNMSMERKNLHNVAPVCVRCGLEMRNLLGLLD